MLSCERTEASKDLDLSIRAEERKFKKRVSDLVAAKATGTFSFAGIGTLIFEEGVMSWLQAINSTWIPLEKSDTVISGYTTDVPDAEKAYSLVQCLTMDAQGCELPYFPSGQTVFKSVQRFSSGADISPKYVTLPEGLFPKDLELKLREGYEP